METKEAVCEGLMARSRNVVVVVGGGGMLRQALERSGIDLIVCTLLIRPHLGEIEKPK